MFLVPQKYSIWLKERRVSLKCMISIIYFIFSAKCMIGRRDQDKKLTYIKHILFILLRRLTIFVLINSLHNLWK